MNPTLTARLSGMCWTPNQPQGSCSFWWDIIVIQTKERRDIGYDYKRVLKDTCMYWLEVLVSNTGLPSLSLHLYYEYTYRRSSRVLLIRRACAKYSTPSSPMALPRRLYRRDTSDSEAKPTWHTDHLVVILTPGTWGMCCHVIHQHFLSFFSYWRIFNLAKLSQQRMT